MTDAAIAPLERAQKLADVAATVAVIAGILMIVGAAGRHIAVPAAEILRDQQVTWDFRGVVAVIGEIARFAILAAPSFMLAGVLFDLGRVLEEYGKGRFFTLRAAEGVRKAGEGALWAMAFKIVISPTLYSWVSHDARGIQWQMEPFDLGLVAFAAFILVLGRVLEAAARIKQENDQIV